MPFTGARTTQPEPRVGPNRMQNTFGSDPVSPIPPAPPTPAPAEKQDFSELSPGVAAFARELRMPDQGAAEIGRASIGTLAPGVDAFARDQAAAVKAMAGRDDQPDAAIAKMIELLAGLPPRLEGFAACVERHVDMLSYESVAFSPELLAAIARSEPQTAAMLSASRAAAKRYTDMIDALETVLWVHTPAGRQED